MTSHSETLAFLAGLEAQHRNRRQIHDDSSRLMAEFGQRPGYGGARNIDTQEFWNPPEYRPNSAWLNDGPTLRRRAWDLYKDNPFAAAGIGSYISNVVECGIWPERDESWDRAFARWSGVDGHASIECDLSRDDTFPELEAHWLQEVLVGGGCLTNYVYVNPKTQRVPLSIELIPEERFADDVTHYGRNSKTRNDVVGGREIDSRTGRTVAFHVYPTSQDDLTVDRVDSVRIPASNARYAYLKIHRGAKRGTTMFRTVIRWLHSLGYYVDSELFASNLRSQFAYVMTEGEGDVDEDLTSSMVELQNAKTGESVDRPARGSVYRTTGGGDIKSIGPSVPVGDPAAWIKVIKQAIAVGLHLSYTEMFRDYEHSTLGTERVSGNADQKRYSPLQNFLIYHFGNPTVQRFDAEAVSAGLPGFPSPTEYLSTADELLETQEWITPGWLSPNPKDDAAADKQNLKNGTTTRKEIAARRGRSLRKIDRQRQREASADSATPPVDTLTEKTES